MNRKKYFQLLILSVLIFGSLTGCGSKAEKETDNVSVDNFYEAMERELCLEPMIMQEPEKAYENIYYTYTDGTHDVRIFCERNSDQVKIAIDDFETDTVINVYGAVDSIAEIGFYDINHDGTEDVILRQQKFRGITSAIYLSENDGYRELAIVSPEEWAARYRDYEAEYLDGFQIRVRCEEFGVDAVLSLRAEAVDWHKQVEWIYDGAGKLVHGEKAADGLYAVAEQAVEYFIKDGELYMCGRSQFVEGNVWSGVCMSLIYKVTGEGFEPVGMYLDEVDMQGW